MMCIESQCIIVARICATPLHSPCSYRAMAAFEIEVRAMHALLAAMYFEVCLFTSEH